MLFFDFFQIYFQNIEFRWFYLLHFLALYTLDLNWGRCSLTIFSLSMPSDFKNFNLRHNGKLICRSKIITLLQYFWYIFRLALILDVYTLILLFAPLLTIHETVGLQLCDLQASEYVQYSTVFYLLEMFWSQLSPHGELPEVSIAASVFLGHSHVETEEIKPLDKLLWLNMHAICQHFIRVWYFSIIGPFSRVVLCGDIYDCPSTSGSILNPYSVVT